MGVLVGVLKVVMQGDGQRRLGGRAMKVGGGNVRGTCGVGMRSKEYCARMSAEPLMQRGATTLGSDTQGQTPRDSRNKDNNNILVATTLPQCPLLFFVPVHHQQMPFIVEL
jgi:hypothetical protein